jgi:DNA helicase-2/ATP-dependent DNA helicase PcrA
VIAAAGSGKTRLLLDVLVSKLRKGEIDPAKDEVIVFTFTNNAADELAFRLTKLLGNEQDLLSRIFIGTIHGWCNDFLKRKGTLANTKVVDELEQYQLVLRIYPIMSLKDEYKEDNKFQKIEAFIKDLELFYNEDLELEDKVVPDKVRKCVTEYLDFVRNQRLLDFGSLIREAIRQLKSHQSPTRYHLFVDEYQDVNLAQVRLFQAILSLNPKSTLFAVGDPRQAIYQWRGSDLRRILNFSSDFDDTGSFTMEMNHRSRPGIVEFSNVIANDIKFSSCTNSNFHVTDMIHTPKREDQAVSVIHEYGDFSHEAEIVKAIKALRDQGVKYSDVAVLMRSVVNHADELMNLFDKANIPYYSPNKNAGIDFINSFVGSIMTLMDLMAEEKEPSNRQEEEEIGEKIQQSLESIRSYCSNTSNQAIHMAVQEWYKELSTPIQTKKDHTYYRNESYNFRKQFFDFCKKVNFTLNKSDTDLQEGFSAVTQIMRAIEEIFRRRFRAAGASLRAAPIDVFLRNLKWQLDHEIERWAETGMEISDSGNRVTISTVHAAKGLEWSVVFVPFLWSKRFPLRNSSHGTSFPDEIAERYGTTIEDEKRLWYVAATRARDRLYFFSGSPGKARKPSPFTYSAFFDKTLMLETRRLEGTEELSEIVHYSRKMYLKIGVSDFLLMIECPFHFYLRRIKGVDVPVGQEFGAGNVLHKVIERLLAESGTDFRKLIDQEVYLPLAEQFFEEKVKRRITKRIKSLLDSGFLEGIQFGENPFKITMENMVIVGIIDAIRETDEGTEIIDWKSSIHERLKNRYENQVRVYSAALRMKGHKVQRGLIYDLHQIARDRENCILQVDISQSKIEELLRKAEANLNSLMKGAPKVEQNLISCNACDVAPVCKYSCLNKKPTK